MDFEKMGGLIPAIIQDYRTNKVLMLGYMNEAALAKTREGKRVTFYSRSKNRLWTKGETSGNYLNVKNIAKDCDQDALLITVNPVGPVCHTGTDTCFKEDNKGAYAFLARLESVIEQAKTNPQPGSYTASLFAKGINKVAQKVGEEAVEVVIEAKDDNEDLFKNECADLLYHYLVLLREKGMDLSEIVGVLEERHKK